jgi:hypothetical protein
MAGKGQGTDLMSMHTGLPVAGYQAQSQERVDLVNANKQIEERVLRMLDDMKHLGGEQTCGQLDSPQCIAALDE